jgi:hypothetical protein
MTADSQQMLLIAAGAFLLYLLTREAGSGSPNRIVIPPDEPLLTPWAPMNGRLQLT